MKISSIVGKAIDKALLPFAPATAVRRAHARTAYAAYEAFKPSERRPRVPRVSSDPNRETTRNAFGISSARDADQNNPIAIGILDTLESNIVGSGITADPQIRWKDGKPAKELNIQVADFIRDWSRRPEATREYNLARAQRLSCRTWMRDGETFTQMLSGRIPSLRHSIPEIPFSFELIEPDYIPVSYTQEDQQIFQGIKRNKWGQPIQYYASKHQPYSGSGIDAFTTADLRTIRAENMAHIKLAKRIKQGRGVTVFAALLIAMQDVKEIYDYERIAGRIAAALTGYIKKESQGATHGFGDEQPKDQRDLMMAPGLILDDLNPGEEIGIIQSNRPNSNIDDFVSGQMGLLSMGSNTGKSSISKRYDGTYSSQRQELVEQYQSYRMLQEEFIDQQVQPIHSRLMLSLHASGLLGNLENVDMRTLTDASFEVPQIPWVDPKKEMDGFRIATENKFMSKTTVQRRMGLNPAHQNEQIEVENDGGSVTADNGDEPSELDQAKQRAEAYGVAVRAGAVTPQIEDEESIRAEMGLPSMTDEVVTAWVEDGGTRRPITIKSRELIDAETEAAQESSENEESENEE